MNDRNDRTWAVWVGGVAVAEFCTEREANEIADCYYFDNYEDVQLENYYWSGRSSEVSDAPAAIPLWQLVARNVAVFALVFAGLPIGVALWRHIGDVWEIGALHGVAALILFVLFVAAWPFAVRFFWQELGRGADSEL